MDVRYYNIIYDAVDEVKAALSGMLAPEKKEAVTGLVEVRQVLHISKIAQWPDATCWGVVKRGSMVRILRDNIVVHAGNSTLSAFQDDVREVKAGFEVVYRSRASATSRWGISWRPRGGRGRPDAVGCGSRPRLYGRRAASPMPRDFSRAARIADQIQRDLSDLIRQEVKDPRIGLVTITAVEVSRDLSHAKVYVSSLGGAASSEQSTQALQHAAGFLRSQLAQMIKVRSIPQLHFIYDVSVERAPGSQLIDEAVASGGGHTSTDKGDED